MALSPKKLIWFSVVLAQLLILALLVTGTEILLSPVLKEPFFPLGNLLAWLLLILFPLSILIHHRDVIRERRENIVYRLFAVFLKISLLLGLGWGWISRYLSGNWNFVFYNKETIIHEWVWLTAFTAGLPLLGLLLIGIYRLAVVIRVWRNSRK